MEILDYKDEIQYSAIQSEGLRNLEEGQKVEFKVERGNKRPQATRATILYTG